MTLEQEAAKIIRRAITNKSPWPQYELFSVSVRLQARFGSYVQLRFKRPKATDAVVTAGFENIIFSREFAESIWPEDKVTENLSLLAAQKTNKGRINFIKSTLDGSNAS